MTASIESSSNVMLKNSAFSSSIETISSFYPHIVDVITTVDGTPAGFYVGSDTTGSLEITGSFKIKGSMQIPGGNNGLPIHVGTEGEILISNPTKGGLNYFLYAYIGGAWKSASLS
jgi:hypothetical protein